MDWRWHLRRVRYAIRGPEPAVSGAARAFWNLQVTRPPNVSWLAHAPVRESANRWIAGESGTWPIDALRRTWLPRCLERGLSIGCGTGALERNLRRADACRRVEALDISEVSIREAERLAREEGLEGIEYRVEDCEALSLEPGRYDIVYFHHSLHHIADPDRLLDQVLVGLKPGGYLYIDEYVGPSRDEWTPETLRWAREAYRSVDRRLRERRPAAPKPYDDPSEMIRSGRILPAIRERFDVLQYRPYWGNLLFPLLSALDGHVLQEPRYQELLSDLIERERELVRTGALTDPMFAVLLGRARTRRGLRGA
jgi:SAM-dependent methyltransferase